MKFYNFDTKNFAYSALIGAKNEVEAINYYIEIVADIEETDGQPEEVSVEDVVGRLMNICKDTEEIKKAKDEFRDYYERNNEPYLVLVDAHLL